MTWFTSADMAALSPLAVLALGAFVVLLADAIVRGARESHALSFISLGTVAMAGLATVGAWTEPRLAGAGSLALGPFAAFAAILVLGCAAIACLYSIDYARRQGFELGEYYGLVLFATAGMLYLIAANDLISLFIAFELMSLSIYALAGISREDTRSSEGALKYFILGSFSSAFLLYGMALLYGATGTLYLDRMAAATAGGPGGLALAAIGLLIVGFAFKVGAVPFHSWIPDAYQGAPASVTGFMAVAVKAAAFAIFFRVLHALGLLGNATSASDQAGEIFWLLAVATMVVGNVAALAQTKIQRMLAYSGIAHSGYVLVGVVAATRDTSGAAMAGALYYLVAYAAMTVGAFAVLTVVRRDGRPIEDVDDLAGLAWEQPAAAAAMLVFMASLLGIPPLAGFMGKLWVFRAAVQAGYTQLVVIAVLTTAVSAYYYLRPVVVMFMSEPAPSAAAPAPSFGGTFAVAIAAAATILLGVFPAGTLAQAEASAKALLAR